jgi:hypothetical protein
VVPNAEASAYQGYTPQGPEAGRARSGVRWAVIPVYRTEGGVILRVIESGDGGIRVEVLDDGQWVPGRIGMVGLRLSPSTTVLTSAEARKLPK